MDFLNYNSVNYRSPDPTDNLRVRVTITEQAGPRQAHEKKNGPQDKDAPPKPTKYTVTTTFSWQQKVGERIEGVRGHSGSEFRPKPSNSPPSRLSPPLLPPHSL
jgi:hypothetical protein